MTPVRVQQQHVCVLQKYCDRMINILHPERQCDQVREDVTPMQASRRSDPKDRCDLGSILAIALLSPRSPLNGLIPELD